MQQLVQDALVSRAEGPFPPSRFSQPFGMESVFLLKHSSICKHLFPLVMSRYGSLASVILHHLRERASDLQ